MEHNDNEQRLRILQERLGQIKNKQEARQKQQPIAEDTAPYPAYNPKATQNSDEDILPTTEEIKVKKSTGFATKTFVRLLILGILVGGGVYLYTNFDFNSLLPEKSAISDQIIPENIEAPLQYSFNFGELANYLVIIASFEDENSAIELMNKKKAEGYKSNYFFLPSVSNSVKQVYKVYLGPYLDKTQAKQWKNLYAKEAETIEIIN